MIFLFSFLSLHFTVRLLFLHLIWCWFSWEIRFSRNRACKNRPSIQHGSRFHQIIVYIFRFCFNDGLKLKPEATKYDFFFFYLTLIRIRIRCTWFFFLLFPDFRKKERSLSILLFFFSSYIWNYWLHNGPVKIKAIGICASASRMECKNRFLLKREEKNMILISNVKR